MARRGRPPGRKSTPVIRTPTPASLESDDGNADADESRVETPQDAEALETEGQDSEVQGDEPSSPPVVQQFPRRKRLGRPPKNRPPDWNNTPEPGEDGASERGTPGRRRGRGRPSAGGFRGRRSGGPSHTTRVPIDKEGNMMDVVDDEVALPEDAEGETKVDKMGNLQGGRDYRVRVFTLKDRGDRLYMLSTEPARCTGFRDSYLFFTKHLQLYKIIIDDAEKYDLIERDIIPHSYKGRAIGVVTARSVFREFGARIIVGGKKVTDDYYAQAARDRGDAEGEIADPNDRLPAAGEAYNKNQYVAWHGASAVYHTGVPSVPLANGKPIAGKRKINITSANWKHEHARAASVFNKRLIEQRRSNLDGVYDPHTNLMWQPKIMQPTHIRWEEIPPEEPQEGVPSKRRLLTNGVAHLTNGIQHVNLNGVHQQRDARMSMFEPVPAIVSRNFLVVDTVAESPPINSLGLPGPDGLYNDIGAHGLANIAEEILAELPPECRAAFEDAKRKELVWKNRWRTEVEDGCRGKLKIGFSGVPV